MTQPALVQIVGGLDLSTVVRWEAEVGKAAAASRTVVLDLAGVDFVDSAGVHGLFRMLASLDAQGKRLVVVAPRGGPDFYVPRSSTCRRSPGCARRREEALSATHGVEARRVPPRP